MTRSMVRWVTSTLVLVLSVGTILATPPESCEALQARVAELESQLERMQREVQALQRVAVRQGILKPDAETPPSATATLPQAKPVVDAAAAPERPATGGREAAVALYDRVDALLVEGKIDEAKAALAEFDTTWAGTDTAAWARSLHRELEVVGRAVPADWSIEKWFRGGTEALDGKGTTVLVFWEVWCPHCKSEVPKIEKLYDDYRERGLKVVGLTRLTRDVTEAEVSEFLDANSVSYPVAKESGALAEHFNVKGIPAAAIVKDGRIVWRGHPMRLTPQFVDRLL